MSPINLRQPVSNPLKKNGLDPSDLKNFMVCSIYPCALIHSAVIWGAPGVNPQAYSFLSVYASLGPDNQTFWLYIIIVTRTTFICRIGFVHLQWRIWGGVTVVLCLWERKKHPTSLQLLKHFSLWLQIYWYMCDYFLQLQIPLSQVLSCFAPIIPS